MLFGELRKKSCCSIISPLKNVNWLNVHCEMNFLSLSGLVAVTLTMLFYNRQQFNHGPRCILAYYYIKVNTTAPFIFMD